MLIIGCGNRDRGDDGAGIVVAERLRELGLNAETCRGEALELIEAWDGADDVVIVDAVVTSGPAGKVWLWDSGQLTMPETLSLSTHGFGVAEGIQLARALDCLPKHLRVFGIEGLRFELRSAISTKVMCAVKEVVAQITAEEVCHSGQGGGNSVKEKARPSDRIAPLFDIKSGGD